VEAVLGPDRRGVIRLAEVDRRLLETPLKRAGIWTTTPAEVGLGLPGPAAPGASAPLPGDRPGLARYCALATRRPAIILAEDRPAWPPPRVFLRLRPVRWIVAAPDGSMLRGSDPARLCRGAMARRIPPRVAVFGGAWIQESEPEYEEIRRLGRWLAERGVHLVCGGYQGAMAAASRGVSEAGGVSVGVTIAEWEDVVTVNEWLTHELVARDLFARLPVITDADAWVAFPGGVGTLQEVALCWNLVQTELARPRPLLLVGEAWDRQLRLFRELLRVSDPAHFDLVRPVATYDDVVEALAPAVARS
jgi:uncharacterized protein (TIGR00730 family)